MSRRSILVLVPVLIGSVALDRPLACVPGQNPQRAVSSAGDRVADGVEAVWAAGSTFSHLISLGICNYDSDCNPWLTPDEREIFFIRYSGQYGPPDAEHQGGWDIYHAPWDPVSGEWGPVTNLGPNVNSSFADRRPTTTSDGDTLFFSRQLVYYSIRSGGEFGPAVELFPGTDPCLSADARRLYYVRNNDIWVAERGPSGAIGDWVNHHPIGPPVNTARSEVRPYIARDDSLLFFSDFGNPRPGGFGDADLWVSRWVGSGWSAPENVGPPINLDRPACTPWLSADGARLYASSESFEGSRGCEDVWVAYRDSLPPPAETPATIDMWTKIGELDGAWNVYDLAEDHDEVLFAATAPNGAVHRSTDGGGTWERTATIPGVHFAQSLLVTGGALFVGVYPAGAVYRTTDKGETWVLAADLPAATAVRALLEISDGRILAGTSPVCRIYQSSDGGQGWTLLSTPPGMQYSVTTLFEDSSGTLFAGGWGNPMMSEDGGSSWTPTLTFPSMASVESFLEDSAGRLWMTGWSHDDGSFVYASTDGGAGWNLAGEVGHGLVRAVRIYDIVENAPGEFLVGFQPGPDTIACRSIDGGASWEPEGTLPGAHEILRFLERSDGTLLAATTPNGDIFRYTPEQGAAIPDGEGGSNRFGLAAVLGGDPNPFRDGTRIRYQVPQEQQVELTIVDAAARQVRSLIEGVVPAGRHRIVWDGRDDEGRRVSSSVYFVRMRAGDSVTYQKIVALR